MINTDIHIVAVADAAPGPDGPYIYAHAATAPPSRAAHRLLMQLIQRKPFVAEAQTQTRV